MAEKKTSLHDEQTSAAAESLRAIVRDVRGGMTQRETEAMLEKIEGVAKGLDDQGKDPKELEKQREESNEPDPTKSAAELVRDTFAADGGDAKKSVSSPGIPGGSVKEDLGKPLVTSQASTKDRDAVEAAKVAGDKTVKDASKK